MNNLKAKVGRADGLGETEGAYLKKKDGIWFVLDQDTGVNPTELGIPDYVLKELFELRRNR